MRTLAALEPVDLALGILREAGFSATAALHAFRTLSSFAYGYALSEIRDFAMESAAGGGGPRPELLRAEAERFPNLAEAIPEAGATDQDAEFEAGLEAIIAGSRCDMASSLSEAASSSLGSPGPEPPTLWPAPRRPLKARTAGHRVDGVPARERAVHAGLRRSGEAPRIGVPRGQAAQDEKRRAGPEREDGEAAPSVPSATSGAAENILALGRSTPCHALLRSISSSRPGKGCCMSGALAEAKTSAKGKGRRSCPRTPFASPGFS